MDEHKLAAAIADHMVRDVDLEQTVALWLATGGAVKLAADLQKSEQN